MNFFILCDWYLNVRKVRADLRRLKDFEFIDSLKYLKDKHNRPKLFKVTATNNDILVFQFLNGKTAKLKVSKIKENDTYASAFTKRVKTSDGYVSRAIYSEPSLIGLIVEKYEEQEVNDGK